MSLSGPFFLQGSTSPVSGASSIYSSIGIGLFEISNIHALQPDMYIIVLVDDAIYIRKICNFILYQE